MITPRRMRKGRFAGMSSSAEPPGTVAEPPAKEMSPWAPLASTRFRVLWLAQFVSGIGTWMQTVGAQWLLLDNGPAWSRWYRPRPACRSSCLRCRQGYSPT
jgi:hypothetical protein